MANITVLQKMLLQKQLGMEGGYVLNFSNNSFQRFVSDSVNINIYDDRYAIYGDSKANRLRASWDQDHDKIVGKLILDLLLYIRTNASLGSREMKSCMADGDLYKNCVEIATALQGDHDKPKPEDEVNSFLKLEMDELAVSALSLEAGVAVVLEQRIFEVKKCLKIDVSLSAIFLCGSILEGILFGIAAKNLKQFNQASTCPRDKITGKTKPFGDWTLSNFIDVAHETGFIGLDVKKFSHSLRDFRNFIHPNEQLRHGFNPDQHTARISWQVLKAAMHDINKKQSSHIEVKQPAV
jgi:hypothetical protein